MPANPASDPQARLGQLPDSAPDAKAAGPLLTLFTILKPFTGKADLHQRNAINSWRALGDEVDILLASDSKIPPDLVNAYPSITLQSTSLAGTPLLDEAFRLAKRQSQSPWLGYINADLLLDRAFLDSVRQITQWRQRALIIGQRTTVAIDQPLQFRAAHWIQDFLRRESNATLDSIVCKDFFVFSRELYDDLPGFIVGRGNWDNWMVWRAKRAGIPVVSISPTATVIHQQHDYGPHRSRFTAYVSGEEARLNQRLAGGRHLVSGSTANWELREGTIRKIAVPYWRLAGDLPRFLRLMRDMLFVTGNGHGTTRKLK